jgi:hypothetical protein
MNTPGIVHRILRWALPAALLGLVAAVVILPKLASGPSRPPTPVTEKRSLYGRRDHDVYYTNEYLYDSTYETCEAVGITQLARKLGVPASPVSRIARAFAGENYESALRDGSYHGCLDALTTQLREEHHRGATYGTLP